MDTIDDTTAKAKATTVLEDQEPGRHQLLRERGRSNTPVVVYDREQKTVQVRNEKNLGH